MPEKCGRLVMAAWCITLGYSGVAGAQQRVVRVATFNVSLYGNRSGEVLQRLQTGDDPQARRLAEVIQRVRPDVLLLNEIDYDEAGDVLREFHDRYLAVGQNNLDLPQSAAEPIDFAYRYSASVNTGRHSGFDLDKNGRIDATSATPAHGGDSWGYGVYEGQYGLAILSKYPVDATQVRTFRNFLWKDMPGAQLPDDPALPGRDDWFEPAALAQAPLSSKSHWDIPVMVDSRRVHLLASHPTPPVFDGPEDRNGRRNHDEIRFWADYVGPADGAAYIYDDAGRRGGLPSGESFIILGDLNGDPHDGDGPEGIKLLLAAPRVQPSAMPASPGGAEQARLQGGANSRHRGDPSHDTVDARDDPAPGNLHIDYVLPSSDLRQGSSGVFWPASDDPLFPLVGVEPYPTDHRMVWVDVEF